MKKDITGISVGIDLGDKMSEIRILGEAGQTVEETRLATKRDVFRKYFGQFDVNQVRIIAIETGTHSSWVAHVLGKEMGFSVVVGQARRLRMIWSGPRKDDSRDADMLARIARLDEVLLCPIEPRSREAQTDLALLKARDALVRARTGLINHIRGVVKSHGERLPACSSESFHQRAVLALEDALKTAFVPLLETIKVMTEQIRAYDRIIKRTCQKYPETSLLLPIGGVGELTSLAYVLTLGNPHRFKDSRSVGAYVGLVPKRDQSGAVDKQLGIAKAGNGYLRKLLVGSAQYMLGPFGPDCQLRRYGLRLAERGGRNGKRRAVVAVARKLAVLMLVLWKTGGVYDPFHEPACGLKAAA